MIILFGRWRLKDKTAQAQHWPNGKDGSDLNGKYFLDIGVFHKGYAMAKDKSGWFHIDKRGQELYSERFDMIEPFYNGLALVVSNGTKTI